MSNEEIQKIAQLVRDIQSGKTDAFADLYDATFRCAWYHATKILKDPQEAEDAVQEAYEAAFLSINKIRQPETFIKWIGSTVTNISLKKFKKLCGQDFYYLDDDSYKYEPSAPETVMPERVMDKSASEQILSGIIDSLSDVQKQTVLLYYFDEMSIKQIAAAMAVSENTVKSRLKYARDNIKVGVQEEEKRGVRLYAVNPLLLMGALERLMEAEKSGASMGTVGEKLSAKLGINICPANAESTAAVQSRNVSGVENNANVSSADNAEPVSGAGNSERVSPTGEGTGTSGNSHKFSEIEPHDNGTIPRLRTGQRVGGIFAYRGVKAAAGICAALLLAVGITAAVRKPPAKQPEIKETVIESPATEEKCMHRWEIEVVRHEAVYETVQHQEEGLVPQTVYIEEFPAVLGGWQAKYYCSACGQELYGREYAKEEFAMEEIPHVTSAHNSTYCPACGNITYNDNRQPIAEFPNSGNAQFISAAQIVFAEGIPAHYGDIYENGIYEWSEKKLVEPAWDELFCVCRNCGERHPLNSCPEPCDGEHRWVKKTVKHQEIKDYVHKSEYVDKPCEVWQDEQHLILENRGWCGEAFCETCGEAFSAQNVYRDDAERNLEWLMQNHNKGGCGEYLYDENGEIMYNENGNPLYENTGTPKEYFVDIYPTENNDQVIPGHYVSDVITVREDWDEEYVLEPAWEEEVEICSVCGKLKPAPETSPEPAPNTK